MSLGDKARVHAVISDESDLREVRRRAPPTRPSRVGGRPAPRSGRAAPPRCRQPVASVRESSRAVGSSSSTNPVDVRANALAKPHPLALARRQDLAQLADRRVEPGRQPRRHRIQRRCPGRERNVRGSEAERDVDAAIPGTASAAAGPRPRRPASRKRPASAGPPRRPGPAPKTASRTPVAPPAPCSSRIRWARPKPTASRREPSSPHRTEPERRSRKPKPARKPPKARPRRRVRAAKREDTTGTARASRNAVNPSAAAWNFAPTSRSGRYASGASTGSAARSERQVRPGEQPEPARTATKPTESVATSPAPGGQERDPQDPRGRVAVRGPSAATTQPAPPPARTGSASPPRGRRRGSARPAS